MSAQPDSKERSYACSDCTAVYPTGWKRTKHAFATGHMRDRTCFQCRAVFNTVKALTCHKRLHQNHLVPEDSKTIPEETEHWFLEHFSTEYWREGQDVKTALKRRPNHGYRWASPAQSEELLVLLADEQLSEGQIIGGKYPTVFPQAKPPRQKTAAAATETRPLPLPVPSTKHAYAALVLDCEMVELADRTSDLVRISVIDFLSGSILLHKLVQPTGHVKDWRSRISGVDPALLRAASASRDPTTAATAVLAGWPEARERIFSLADANTIFVGHALANDLHVLHIAAHRVVDTMQMTASAAFGHVDGVGFPRTWGLRAACEELMAVRVQQRQQKHHQHRHQHRYQQKQQQQNAAPGGHRRRGLGAQPHDPLEDALAARELAVWCLTHPRQLAAWGRRARKAFEENRAARLEAERCAAARKRRRQEQEEGEMRSEEEQMRDWEMAMKWNEMARAAAEGEEV
ncbi:putative RNA exonuclease 3 [Rosellinia necatrix]|uniref:Putative RNA exonuclease 3 n=1 Tax=Rosellinia necatrix TaxID=77044 RepID=A0A1W2TQA4_ROSNE|nr:putative RNA exonuclease 3 [Rosellinia necatrix]